ncbi:MAG: A/G-specific adenine glycosylase [Planctomycetota bacterium]|nr:A/G-specific adenine glycosylase [Planctomycetota bacterium]MDA1179237.1 A/G-specific adenine glycosylase [Planctomycetota bacterium]
MPRNRPPLPDPVSLLESPPWRKKVRQKLLRWYAGAARDLPWRKSRNPYHIWVSEVMLQQTQVATVIPYFARFIDQFPTIDSLAVADEEQVLRLWEGLGYYRRARQLHRAAREIVATHQGQFPSNPTHVERLPGIGRYTAGAILSIAFDARRPILEANTIRLFSRLLAYDGDPRSAHGQELLWRAAEILLPRREIGQFNQAIMELGSLVCTPRQPACGTCPLRSLCPTFAANLQDEIPKAARRVQYEEIHEAAVVIWRGRKVWLRRCVEGERWAGLWDFPRFPCQTSDKEADAYLVQEKAERQSQSRLGNLRQWTQMKHGVTRFRIQLTVFQADFLQESSIAEGTNPTASESRWITVSQLNELPLSATGRKIAQQLSKPPVAQRKNTSARKS